MRQNEVDLDDAIDMTGLDAEDLMRLAGSGKLRTRRNVGFLDVYFLREEIDALIDHMIAIGRSGGNQFSVESLDAFGDSSRARDDRV